jgi:hypothetical protein
VHRSHCLWLANCYSPGILASSKGLQTNVLCPAWGARLRAGEAIGLEIDKHISEDFRTLYDSPEGPESKVRNFLKTDAGRRDADLCPALATMLKAFVGELSSGGFSPTRPAGFSQRRIS